jgi:hypothetical protein
LNRTDTKGILLNLQTAKNMGTPKIIAVSNQDVSKAKVNTWQTNATKMEDQVMSDVSSVVDTILANYKGCTIYKDLQKKTNPPLGLKIYTAPSTNQTNL